MRVRIWVSIEQYGEPKRFHKFELPTWALRWWKIGEGVVRLSVNPRDRGLVCHVCGCNPDSVILCRACKEKRCRGQCKGKGLSLVERTYRWQQRYKHEHPDKPPVILTPTPPKQGWWATVKDIWKLLFFEPPDLNIKLSPPSITTTHIKEKLPIYKKKQPAGPPEEFEV